MPDDPDEVGDSVAILGPRQQLLESAPCSRCHQSIVAMSLASIVCDGCNAAFHLSCVGMKEVPVSYWYCNTCAKHIRARGCKEPAEDVPFLRYLLSGKASAENLGFYTTLATWYRYEQRTRAVDGKMRSNWQLQRKIGVDTWRDYPSPAERALLMEEEHLRGCHVGGTKLYSLLAQRYWWPDMQASCVQFTRSCLAC